MLVTPAFSFNHFFFSSFLMSRKISMMISFCSAIVLEFLTEAIKQDNNMTLIAMTAIGAIKSSNNYKPSSGKKMPCIFASALALRFPSVI